MSAEPSLPPAPGAPTPATSRTAGFLLALCTAMIWGTLPVILKVLLGGLDPFTLTWYRFLAAGSIIGAVVARRHGLASPFRLRGAPLGLGLICALGLSGNYVVYLSGLQFISPATAQVVIQLSPMFVLVGGLLIYRESFSRTQRIGLVVLVLGLAGFFNQRYADLLAGLGEYASGILLIVVAAVLWASFALAQKRLLDHLPSTSILFLVYLSGVVFILPFAHPLLVLTLSRVYLMLLAASVLLTIVSYLCFAGALKRLEASRTGVVISLTPLITVTIVSVLAIVIPGAVEPERLNALGFLGAALVVVGSMSCSLGRG